MYWLGLALVILLATAVLLVVLWVTLMFGDMLNWLMDNPEQSDRLTTAPAPIERVDN